MTIEQYQRTLNTQPFQPFTITMADGTSYRIPHREFTAASPDGETVVVFHDDGSASLLDLMLISELRIESSKQKRRGRTK